MESSQALRWSALTVNLGLISCQVSRQSARGAQLPGRGGHKEKATGAQLLGRQITMGAPNHCVGPEKYQKCHKYFL